MRMARTQDIVTLPMLCMAFRTPSANVTSSLQRPRKRKKTHQSASNNDLSATLLNAYHLLNGLNDSDEQSDVMDEIDQLHLPGGGVLDDVFLGPSDDPLNSMFHMTRTRKPMLYDELQVRSTDVYSDVHSPLTASRATRKSSNPCAVYTTNSNEEITPSRKSPTS